MIKKILATIAFVMVLFACATSPNIPTEPGVGYSHWKGAPGWASKDCIYGGFGLVDGFSFENEYGKFHALAIDVPDDGLDGECDVIVLLQERGYGERPQGYSGPLVVGLGTAPCDKFDELRKELGGQLDAELL